MRNAQGVPPVIGPSKPPIIPPGTKAEQFRHPGSQPPPIPVSAIPKRTPVLQKREPILTPDELDRFKNLLVFAKAMVEGYFSGKHRSPYRGSSAEFADYKEYVAGDDIGHMDWRVYGRSRRLYIRQFEEETDMTIYLLVDTSASMRYAGQSRQPKFFTAAKIAAALSYLMMHQGDKVALGLFAEKMDQFIAPGGTRRHLHRIVTELEKVEPAQKTGIAQAISESGAVFKKRGKLIVLSDFLCDTNELFDALGQFLHRKFDVLLLQVLDPDELNLPPVSVAKFQDMETGEEVQVEPEEIRKAYRKNMEQFLESIAHEADQRQIGYSLVDSSKPYLHAIEIYLGFRNRNVIGQ
ncbi:MAG: DUF58 domain-containing protein [Verrucomicrobia bacterium]|nr:DUF58 domain-containing protein [Verrucomicrobiota bacterium]